MENGNVLEKQARLAVGEAMARNASAGPSDVVSKDFAPSSNNNIISPTAMARGASLISQRQVYGMSRGPSTLPTTMIKNGDELVENSEGKILVNPTKFERSGDVASITESITSQIQVYPNELVKYRHYLREYLAEFMGTMVFLIFGFGSDCVATLSSSTTLAAGAHSNPVGVAFGWGIGLALGLWISGGISGGHLNPAVTLSLAAFGKFPLRKVPGFIFAQLLGAIVATLIVFGNYQNAILSLDAAKTTLTSSMFVSTPTAFITPATAFFSEFIGTAILVGVIFAITDESNNPPPKGLVPLALQFTLTALALAWGWETSFSFNPARDFGPRIALAMLGYGSQLFTTFHVYFIWGTILAPICGGIFGAFLYDLTIFTGGESWLNASTGEWAKKGLVLGRGARAKGPAGIAADDTDI